LYWHLRRFRGPSKTRAAAGPIDGDTLMRRIEWEGAPIASI